MSQHLVFLIPRKSIFSKVSSSRSIDLVFFAADLNWRGRVVDGWISGRATGGGGGGGV